MKRLTCRSMKCEHASDESDAKFDFEMIAIWNYSIVSEMCTQSCDVHLFSSFVASGCNILLYLFQTLHGSHQKYIEGRLRGLIGHF